MLVRLVLNPLLKNSFRHRSSIPWNLIVNSHLSYRDAFRYKQKISPLTTASDRVEALMKDLQLAHQYKDCIKLASCIEDIARTRLVELDNKKSFLYELLSPEWISGVQSIHIVNIIRSLRLVDFDCYIELERVIFVNLVVKMLSMPNLNELTGKTVLNLLEALGKCRFQIHMVPHGSMGPILLQLDPEFENFHPNHITDLYRRLSELRFKWSNIPITTKTHLMNKTIQLQHQFSIAERRQICQGLGNMRFPVLTASLEASALVFEVVCSLLKDEEIDYDVKWSNVMLNLKLMHVTFDELPTNVKKTIMSELSHSLAYMNSSTICDVFFALADIEVNASDLPESVKMLVQNCMRRFLHSTEEDLDVLELSTFLNALIALGFKYDSLTNELKSLLLTHFISRYSTFTVSGKIRYFRCLGELGLPWTSLNEPTQAILLVDAEKGIDTKNLNTILATLDGLTGMKLKYKDLPTSLKNKIEENVMYLISNNFAFMVLLLRQYVRLGFYWPELHHTSQTLIMSKFERLRYEYYVDLINLAKVMTGLQIKETDISPNCKQSLASMLELGIIKMVSGMQFEDLPALLYSMGKLNLSLYKHRLSLKKCINGAVDRLFLYSLTPEDVSMSLYGLAGIGVICTDLPVPVRSQIEQSIENSVIAMNGRQVSETIQALSMMKYSWYGLQKNTRDCIMKAFRNSMVGMNENESTKSLAGFTSLGV